MTDWLSAWWIHDVQVQRRTRLNLYDEEGYADTEIVTGFYRDGQANVRTGTGDMPEASGRFAYPHSVATIPLRSKLILPAVFGGDEVEVVASNVADGPEGTPLHKIVEVK